MKAKEILKKRKDRSIAIILNVKEKEVDPLLTSEGGGDRASRLMRKVILDQFNDFYDMAIDIVESGEANNFEFNAEIWVKKIEGHFAEIQRELARRDDGS